VHAPDAGGTHGRPLRTRSLRHDDLPPLSRRICCPSGPCTPSTESAFGVSTRLPRQHSSPSWSFLSRGASPTSRQRRRFRSLPQRREQFSALATDPRLRWLGMHPVCGRTPKTCAVSSRVQGDHTAHLGRIGRSIPSVSSERLPTVLIAIRRPRRTPHRRQRNPGCLRAPHGDQRLAASLPPILATNAGLPAKPPAARSSLQLLVQVHTR